VARVLPPCPFPPRLDEASAGFEVFRDRAVSPDTSCEAARCRAFVREEPSLEVRLPVSLRGALPERLSPSSAPALAGARVRLSWGSSSLRRLQLQVPRICHDRLDRPRETRDTTPSSGSALGFSQPLGGLSRDDIRRARVAPNPPFTPSLHPEASRPCCMPRRPWDSPFRAFPSRGAVPPLGGLLLPRGFDVDRDPGAKTPCVSDRFPPCAASWPCSEPPRRDDRARLETREHRLPATVSPPHHHASFPARRLSERQRTFGLAGTRPCRPPRSFAPLGSPFTRPTARFPRACARRMHGRPGRCSPGISPLQSLLHHDLGFGRLRRPPGGEAERSRKSKPRSGRRNRGFDPEV
jgi:hypothetical protein